MGWVERAVAAGLPESEVVQALRELLEDSDSDSDSEVSIQDREERVLSMVARLCGFESVAAAARACEDMARMSAPSERWVPVFARGTGVDMTRFLDACRLAEHLGDAGALVAWLVEALRHVCLSAEPSVAEALAAPES